MLIYAINYSTKQFIIYIQTSHCHNLWNLNNNPKRKFKKIYNQHFPVYIVEKLVTCTLKKTERLIGTNLWSEANQMFCVVRVDSQSVNKLLEVQLGRDCSVVGKKWPVQ